MTHPRRYLAAAAAAVALLAGCGQNPEAEFRELIAAEMPGVDTTTALQHAWAACALMDSGTSMLEVTWGIVDAYPTPRDAGYVVGAGIETFCPQHLGKIGL
jgi:hypothetical protein